MLTQIIATAGKDLQIMAKDPGALALLFMMPLVFILVMSLALANLFASDGGTPVQVLLVNEDAGPVGESVAATLASDGGFDAVTAWEGAPLTRARAEELILARAFPAAIVIPPDFSQAAARAAFSGPGARPRPATIHLLSDPATPAQIVGPLRGALSGLSQQAASVALAPSALDLLFTQIERGGGTVAASQREELKAVALRQGSGGALVAVHELAPPGMPTERRPNAVEQNVPGYTLFGVFFIAQQLAASLLDERRLGTFRRLLAAPLSRAALLLGKLLAFLLINLAQIALMFSVGLFVLPLLGAPPLSLGAHPLALLPISLAVALAANGLGLLIAALARTHEQASGLGLLLVIPMAVLGGVMAPRTIMPEAMQTIGLLSPHTWALQAYQDVILRGADGGAILAEVAALLLFALAFFVLALWRFRWG